MSIDQFLHLGMRALKSGDAERAAEVFHHFNDLHPADARGYVGLALLEKRRWALDRACNLSRKAVLLQPKKLRICIGHATACADNLEIDEALRMMARALVMQPDDADLRTHFGLLHLRAGDWPRGFALDDYRGSRRALLALGSRWRSPLRGHQLHGQRARCANAGAALLLWQVRERDGLRRV